MDTPLTHPLYSYEFSMILYLLLGILPRESKDRYLHFAIIKQFHPSAITSHLLCSNNILCCSRMFVGVHFRKLKVVEKHGAAHVAIGLVRSDKTASSWGPQIWIPCCDHTEPIQIIDTSEQEEWSSRLRHIDDHSLPSAIVSSWRHSCNKQTSFTSHALWISRKIISCIRL